ncbi:hypothetical protein ANCDUO_07296 [Ancylostoma duodenale]|uniref:Uncharacterized protein n=1 Tax=Ancylostoma duodenale TaxID=51022 RepID=A0A0C2GZ87_9BILA|nr:hypothetical protein ANCDUO_07296 [Ancylostoma duodenale]
MYRVGFARTCPTSSMPIEACELPDLNVMDYFVWVILEEKACAKRYGNLDALKSSIKKAWEEIPQETLRAAVESYPKRLKAVIKAKGGYLE